MKSQVSIRMTEFLIAVVAVIAFVLITESSAWKQINRLRDELRIEEVRQVDPSALTEMRSEAGSGKILATIDEGLLQLQRFLFLALTGLLICGVVILALAYRRMVGPLRSSLAESRVLIERQEKLASLGVFATGIAHEIRNPITAIKVRLFTLKGSHDPGTGEFEDLQVIESEINRLERIVQEFLRFARPADPDLITMQIDAFLQEVHSLMLPELKKRGVDFELRLEANESVRIDPEKMKQVMFNFIQNAADSIEGSGRVILASRKDRRVVDGRSLPAVTIEIIDTGKGMPIEVQKRLFDPFFTTKENGTGLGLPIAARIVEKHGGLIQYVTEPGQGTSFSILLPRASA
jgi:signal transduction histidine kinase